MDERYIVEIDNYSLTFLGQTEKALRNIDIKVKEGEVVGILGPTGAGKTSLLLSLNGVIPNDIPAIQEGRITVNNINVMEHDVTDMARHVGVVLDTPDTQLLASTVFDDIAFGPSNLGLDSTEILRRVEHVLEVSRLKGKELRNPLQLSGGEQQNLAIAGVLAMDPPVLALDEPISMLDPVGKETVMTLLRSIAKERKRTIIMTESGSDLEVTLTYFDRVIVLSNGEVVADGSPEEIVYSGILERVGVGEPQVTTFMRRLQSEKYPVKPTLDINIAASMLAEIVDGRSVEPIHENHHIHAGEPVLKMENVRHVYPTGVEALKGVSLEIYQGEMVGIVGSNGSGKTTLCMHAVGVLKPTNPDGRVIVMGHDTRKMKIKEIIKHINYVYQLPDNMLFQEKVVDEIAFAPQMMGFGKDKTAKIVDEMLDLFWLREYADSYIFYLPRNIKRLLSLACVLATRPSIIMVDEPTTGLDRGTAEKVMKILQCLNREGLTIVLISHNMELVGSYCRRVVVMDSGNIIADGPTRKIFSDKEIMAKANLRPPQIMSLFKDVPALSQLSVLSLEEALGVFRRLSM